MTYRPLASASLAVALSLLSPLAPHRAAACSPPPYGLHIAAVGTAQAAGPFVFSVVCFGNGGCDEEPTLKVTSADATTEEISGTVTRVEPAAWTFSLLRFVPNSPLEPGQRYVAQLISSHTTVSSTEFEVAAPFEGSPLDSATAEIEWHEVHGGTLYECPYASGEGPGLDGCGFGGTYAWMTEISAQPFLRIELERHDGWVSRIGPLKGSDEVAPASVVEIRYLTLTPGVEGCVDLDAYNVYTGEEIQRTLCATAPEPSPEQLPHPASAPALAWCGQPPTTEGAIAEDLLDPWCRQRGEVCLRAEAANLDADCRGFVKHCDVEAIRAVLIAETDIEFDEGSDTPPDAPADAAPPEDARSSESPACAVGSPGLRARQPWAGWIACIGLAALFVRRRRRPR